MIIPLSTRVLLKKIIDDHKQGLIITTAKQEDKFQGIVKAKGSECTEDFKVSDVVQYERYTGTAFQDDYLIIDEKHIIAVIE